VNTGGFLFCSPFLLGSIACFAAVFRVRSLLSLLFQCLPNSVLERESIFAEPLGCVRSLPDLVSLSVDAVDCLLSDGTVWPESADALLSGFSVRAPILFRCSPASDGVHWESAASDVVAPDEAPWAGVSALLRMALGFPDHRPLHLPAGSPS
jgi:hypothetical protein